MSENKFQAVGAGAESTSISYSRALSRGMHAYHEHCDYELAVLISGSGWCYLDSDVFRMQPGHIYIIPPNRVHMMSYSEQETHAMYHIYFRPDLLTDIRQQFDIPLEPALSSRTVLELDDELRARLDHALSFIKRRPQTGIIDSAIRHLLVESILLSMARQLGLDSGIPDPAVSHPVVQELLSFIARHFSDDLTLDMLSSHTGLNRSYLCRLFKKELGLTITEYINSVRIRNACRLLRESDQNITQISLQSGFNSTAYFDRQFRTLMGMSPTAYLNEYRPHASSV